MYCSIRTKSDSSTFLLSLYYISCSNRSNFHVNLTRAQIVLRFFCMERQQTFTIHSVRALLLIVDIAVESNEEKNAVGREQFKIKSRNENDSNKMVIIKMERDRESEVLNKI